MDDPKRTFSRRRVLGAGSATVAGLTAGCLGGDGGQANELPCEGDPELLQDVQTHPSEGTDHVESGTSVEYDTMPPTSGPHYSSATDAGFYEETPPLGNLVHSLEHGAVVIYYDPEALSSSAEEDLTELASTYTDTWASVIVAPHPESSPEAPYVLTAWRHLLRLEEYREDVVRAFLAEFLGRGPENQVREPC